MCYIIDIIHIRSSLLHKKLCMKIISEYIFEKAQLRIFFKFISFFLVFISWESGYGTDCINLHDRSYGVRKFDSNEVN